MSKLKILKVYSLKLNIAFIGFFLILFCIFPVVSNARSTDVSIDMNIVIYDDGSMLVSQLIDGYFSDGSTKTITIDTPKFASLTNISVTNTNGVYEYVEEMDTSAGLLENKNKYTIIKNDGDDEENPENPDNQDNSESQENEITKIVFGLGEYGRSRFAVEYKISNIVTGYTDLDGLAYDFFQIGRENIPVNIKAKIYFAYGEELSESNTRIWTHGFTSEYEFERNYLTVTTKLPIKADESFILMLGFAKDLFTPLENRATSFMAVRNEIINPEQEILNKGVEKFYVFLISIVLLTICMIIAKQLYEYYIYYTMKTYAESFGYFPGVPNHGEINVSYALGRILEVCEDSSIVSFGILSLLIKGALLPLEEDKNSNGMISLKINTKTSWGLSNNANPNISDLLESDNLLTEYDHYLYNILLACSKEDIIKWTDLSNLTDFKKLFGVFENDKARNLKNVESFSNISSVARERINIKDIKHYISMYKTKCHRMGVAFLKQHQLIRKAAKPMELKYFTEDGKLELAEILGFKEFIENFAYVKHNEKYNIEEWQGILTYSLLFDMDKDTFEVMLKLYPEIEEEIKAFYDFVIIAYSYGHKLSD